MARRVTERWEFDRLAGFDAQTDRDGDTLAATGRRAPSGGLQVAGSVPMISTQNGRLFRPQVSEIGAERIGPAHGGPVLARHYDIAGSLRLNVWYAGNDWVGFAFTAKDGSTIAYARL